MASSIHPQLSHCGVYARDVSKMVDFYTNVVGLVVSDRGISSRGGELAFMTAAPGHHHQFVIVSGPRARKASARSTSCRSRFPISMR